VRPLEANQAGDYSILRVDGRPGDAWGTVRLNEETPRPGEPLLVVHHPAGRPKHITRGNCRAGKVPVRDGQLFHKCDTLPGSSGAPIFSADSDEALALHYAGAPGPGPDRYNYGNLVASLGQSSRQISAVLEAHHGSKGPEMVTIPAGSFRMGCVSGKMCSDDELPVRTVTFDKPFAIGKYEVTFTEYDRFAEATGREKPNDRGWGRGQRPVIYVSWDDAHAYAAWLSEQTGKRYRLPTEAEWEYATRGGTETPFSTGQCIDTDQANYDGDYDWKDCPRTGVDRGKTVEVGSLPANPWGLHEVHGNVSEWVQDCWHENYQDAPRDGSAWEEAGGGHCGPRVVRGGSGGSEPEILRSANRDWFYAGDRFVNLGFRLAQDL
jgi:formylglycine-generating enzyme required for sulfatase activity